MVKQAQQVNGLVQERCNSIANALELCLSCTNPLKYKDQNHVDGSVQDCSISSALALCHRDLLLVTIEYQGTRQILFL